MFSIRPGNITGFPSSMRNQAAVLNAMANDKRLEILRILQDEECNVGKLAAEVRLSQSAVSQHLAKLRKANLVGTRRDAQQIFYSSNSPVVAAVLAAIDEIDLKSG